MRNLVDYSSAANDDLDRLKAAAADPDEIERVVNQLELCLRWYEPRLDPFTTTSCGAVTGPGLLPAPHYTALSIETYPLRFYFKVDDSIQPYIMTVVRVEWVLALLPP